MVVAEEATKAAAKAEAKVKAIPKAIIIRSYLRDNWEALTH